MEATTATTPHHRIMRTQSMIPPRGLKNVEHYRRAEILEPQHPAASDFRRE
jgi:hypothetical protein